MNDLGKRLLRDGRRALGPSDAQKRALRRKITVAAAAGAAGAGTLTAATSAKGLWAGTALGWKILGIVMAATAVSATVIVATRDPSRAPVSTTPHGMTHHASASPARAASIAPAVEPAPEPVVAPPSPIAALPAAPAAVEPHATSHHAQASRTSVPRASVLREEAEQLLRANALVGRDPAAALASAQARLGDSSTQLREEWLALKIVAMCRTGARSEAERAKRDFLHRYPHSVHVPRITRACAPPQR